MPRAAAPRHSDLHSGGWDGNTCMKWILARPLQPTCMRAASSASSLIIADIGIDSLLMTSVANGIRAGLGVQIPLLALMETQTVDELTTIFALESPFHGMDNIPDCSMQQYCSFFVDAIHRVQPTGLYMLGGWSISGGFAYDLCTPSPLRFDGTGGTKVSLDLVWSAQGDFSLFSAKVLRSELE
ncbi:Putative phosphopantetheine binding ACP domain, alpha/Beta hydrolase, ACP-like superfamily [Colletotrichum destructivum]|uniref:Phosphopantetheine binding ACP domain, alpha/Beta hydrolase, ACP-like superfamily n=1 Tax=Colletotrichum destructivum TaxID=34406 RepID=A0AAX4I6M7_9PEZI|nr:Putative phosphopantetheine binding ACP domain, alpha/Beta hydrolase, ACP-like superfamily [Colletotrichum destructivum]